MSLTHSQLWQRVKQLENDTVRTFTRDSANTIVSVDRSKVNIEGKSPVWFGGQGGIYANYNILVRDGHLSGANLNGRWVIIPILHRALGNSVETLPGAGGIALVRRRRTSHGNAVESRSSAEHRYWVTFHFPADCKGKHEGVWVPLGKAGAIKNMKPGDLVFVYETQRDKENKSNRAVGAQAVVALLEVARKTNSPREGKRIRVFSTRLAAEGNCPERDLKSILRKEDGSHYERFQSFGPGNSHVKEISVEEYRQVMRFFQGQSKLRGEAAHSGLKQLRSSLDEVSRLLEIVGDRSLTTPDRHPFVASAKRGRQAKHKDEKVVVILRNGLEFARIYACCWGHAINCNGTRIGGYSEALDHWAQANSTTAAIPPSAPKASLALWHEYSRQEVHDVFAPNVPFASQRGTWELHGIVSIPGRPGDFVFLVTLGKQQGKHPFDEGITQDGVLIWEPQPRQSLETEQIRLFVNHDDLKNSIYVLLRTKRDLPYTYLGRVTYVSHDPLRERPVRFRWQLLDWPIPDDVRARMNLSLQPSEHVSVEDNQLHDGELVKTDPPPRSFGKRTSATKFAGRKGIDYAESDAKNRRLGRIGELLVINRERTCLARQGHPDLAEMVRHIAEQEGDGAGYDILSIEADGSPKYIEVKTTKGLIDCPFTMSRRELEFSRIFEDHYYLYRVYECDETRECGKFYEVKGNIEKSFTLEPKSYKVRLA